MDQAHQDELLDQILAEATPIKVGSQQRETPRKSHKKKSGKREATKKSKTHEELSAPQRLDNIRTIIREHLDDASPLFPNKAPKSEPTDSIYKILGKERIIAISIQFYKKVYSGEYLPFVELFQQRLVPIHIAIEGTLLPKFSLIFQIKPFSFFSGPEVLLNFQNKKETQRFASVTPNLGSPQRTGKYFNCFELNVIFFCSARELILLGTNG